VSGTRVTIVRTATIALREPANLRDSRVYVRDE
jgi:hypothetical protein